MITAIGNYPKKSEVYKVINGWVYVHTDFKKLFALCISVLLSGQWDLYISLQRFESSCTKIQISNLRPLLAF